MTPPMSSVANGSSGSVMRLAQLSIPETRQAAKARESVGRTRGRIGGDLLWRGRLDHNPGGHPCEKAGLLPRPAGGGGGRRSGRASYFLVSVLVSTLVSTWPS